MQIQKLVVRSFLGSIFVFAALAGVISVAAADTTPKYKIAVIIPLSGNVASLGNYVKRGIDLAYESLPRDVREKLGLVYEDDQFDSTKTVTAYRKLVGTEGVDAVFVIGSPPANALGPILEHDKKLLFAIGASDPTIAVGKTYSFIHWVIPPVLGETLATELQRRDLRRIGFICAEASGTIADMHAVVDALTAKSLGDRVVYQGTFSKDESDYRTALQHLRQQRVDGVVVALFPGALSSFAKQFRASGISAELIGMETFEDEREVEASQGALEGAWYVNASDATDWFVEKYRSKFNEHPGWASANGYDALSLIADAVAAGKQENDGVRDFLRAVKERRGASGTFSASGDNRFTLPAALKRITGGKFVILDNRTSAGKDAG